ncbi:MAG TPA: hypothetical protein P5186_23245 [Candidatus Paceibacterota bacterium]|nr:hypothetical protein [Verrucomicrobiota bacterium]HRY50974.1 hypothetical protein [Candidatus Paceibacterota bacterium]HSA00238.1 hypothetical protein [Candidatus Paceibacterota bacterium]
MNIAHLILREIDKIRFCAIFSIALAATPALAQTFTVGMTSTPDSYNTIAGQSFTPTILGPDGSGTPPGPSDLVNLMSFTFAFNTTGEIIVPETLYIVPDSLITSGMSLSTAISHAIYSTSDYSDINANLSFGGYSTRTFNFTSGVELTAGTTYAALLESLADLRQVATTADTAYTGGMEYWSNWGDVLSGDGPDPDFYYDASFSASFAAVPEPRSTAILVATALLGFATIRRFSRPTVAK